MWHRLLISVCIVGFWFGSVRAEIWYTPPGTPPVVSGIFYLAPGGGFGIVNLPSLAPPVEESTLASSTGQSVLTGKTALFFGGGGLTFGFAFPENSLPKWLGALPRLEFAGGFSLATNTSQTNAPRRFAFYFPVNGGPGTQFGGGAPIGFTLGLRTQYRSHHVKIRFRTDYLVAPNLLLTVSAAAAYGGSRVRYRANSSYEFPAEALIYQLRESINTHRIGGEFGLELTRRITGSLFLLGGMNVALHHVTSRLKATDCLGAPRPTCNGNIYATSTSDRDRRFGARLGGFLGIGGQFGRLRVAITGSVAWDSAVAGVSNPGVNNPGAASLRFGSGLTYGAVLSIVISSF
jgi:hypothetical protein